MEDLVGRLRAWSRRYEPRSQERTLMLAAADRIVALEEGVEAEVQRRIAERGPVTPEVVEEAMGGARLFPWQRKKLGGS